MQDLVKSYKQFSTSYYVRDGLRITFAIMLPIIVFSMLGDIRAGVTTALGVLCVSICDSPGPLHHRINGMLIAISLVFTMVMITGFSVQLYWLMAIEILVFSFLFSMIGIYGARATSIGIAGLLIMILHIDELYTPKMVVRNAAYILMGGTWYFFLSLALNHLRPYKLAQQAIGDAILSTAKYMHLKGLMYDRNTDYDENYRNLISMQVTLHTKQDLVREILFKTRSIVKDTTPKGRTLLAVFKDSVDLFEQVMASHIDYKSLQQTIDENLLHVFERTIAGVAMELESIGVAMQTGNKSIPHRHTVVLINELEIQLNHYRKQHLTKHNREALLGLEQVTESIRSIHSRILIMHHYTAYDPQFTASVDPGIDRNKFISSTDISLERFSSNLNFGSNIFRYSVRVCVTLFIGYLSLRFLPFGHNYWILLTILVILKPAYSLTKKRNIQRLTGTILGIVIGALILYGIKNEYLLLGIMILSMIGAYSFMRVQYFPFVVLMTIYLLISFYLLKTDDFNKLIIDRIIDTAIGSALAFLATFLIPPKWEKEQIGSLMKSTIQANKMYFKYVTGCFVNKSMDIATYKLLRKEAYVALANLSDAFQRMLSEPEHKQVKGVEIYNMVVNNHLLLSHTSTLASYIPMIKNEMRTNSYKAIVSDVLKFLEHEKNIESSNLALNNEIKALMEEASDTTMEDQKILIKAISEQLQYIHKISKDIHRLLHKNSTLFH